MAGLDAAAARSVLGRGVAVAALGSWVEQAVSLLGFFLLARLLAPEAFGLMAMASAAVVVGEFLVRETLSDLVIAEQDPGPDYLDAVFWSLAGIGGLLALILAALAEPLARLYGEPQVRALVLALAPTVLMIALTAVPVALLRRSLRFGALSARAVAGVAVGAVVGLALAWTGWGIWSLVAQRLAQVGTNVALAWVSVGWRPRLVLPRAHILRLGRRGGQMMGLRAAELSATQLPSILIGAVLGPVPLGYFAIAWKLVEAGSFLILTPLRTAAQPIFAAMRRGAEPPAALLLDLSRLTGFVALPAFAGLAALAAPLLLVLAGPDWPPAAPALALLAPYGAYLCITRIEQAFCLAHGRPGPLSALAWVEVGLASLAVWAAAASEGLAAAVAALVLTLALLWPVRSRVTARLGGVGTGALLRPHLLPLLAALAMAAAVALADRALALAGVPAVPRLAATVALGVALYAGLVTLLMRDRLALARALLGRPRGPAPPGPPAAADPE